jgi:hypothetical protein
MWYGLTLPLFPQDSCDLEESDAELEECVANFDAACRDKQGRLADVQRQINTKRIEKESMQDKYQRVRGRDDT